jgi:hypothetical protein
MPQSSSGGLFGGHPIATGRGLDDSRPRGILSNYDDPDWGHAGSLSSQPFDAPNALPLIGNRLSGVDRLVGGLLTNPPALTTDPQFPDFGSQRGPTGQFTGSQPSWRSQPLSERDYPQVEGVGVPGALKSANPFPPGWLQPSSVPTQDGEFPRAQTYKTLNIDARIHHPGGLGWSGLETGGAGVTPSGSAEGDVQGDWSAYLHHAADVVRSGAVTGDPRIDRTTELLLDALVETVNEMGTNAPPGMRAMVFGTGRTPVLQTGSANSICQESDRMVSSRVGA